LNAPCEGTKGSARRGRRKTFRPTGQARCRSGIPAARIAELHPFKSVTDCACGHFAAAIWRTKGRVRESHVESPCFVPHGGSKKKAEAIVNHPTHKFIQPPICGSKKKAEAIGDRPVKPRLPLFICSRAPKCIVSPNSRTYPRRWDPGQSLGRDAPLLSFPPCKAHFLSAKENGGCAPVPPVGGTRPRAPSGAHLPRPARGAAFSPPFRAERISDILL
jgi:hypothetical protein